MTKPLFMWAGGKTRMIKKYQDLLEEVEFDRYIEPFFGGGAMFVWAYKKNPDASFIINDVNADIMGIYRAIKHDVEEFEATLDALSDLYLPLEKAERKDFFYALRNRNAFHFDTWSETKQAAVLYFLMKTAFNGIWQINKNTNNRFGTPAGLLNQVDKVYDKSIVEWWHKALQNCTILSEDFAQLHKYINPQTFLFMDPPYRNSFTQYNTDFNDDEQRRVIDTLRVAQESNATGWLSNRDAGDRFFEENAPEFSLHRFETTYTAGRRKKVGNEYKAKKATEILLTTTNT